jgi:hypothetical protein
MKGPFLVDCREIKIARYFGREPAVTIPDEIETLGSSSFRANQQVCEIQFGAESKLRSIESRALSSCLALQSMSIPASVTILGQRCFSTCLSLRVVSFVAGSKLEIIKAGAFQGCQSLRRIFLPASVTILEARCFSACLGLELVKFGIGSKLVRIETLAFRGCRRLKAISLPQLVESIGEGCFYECWTLSDFSFSAACRLRELLDLPPFWVVVGKIPDSVEILRFLRHMRFPFSQSSTAPLRQCCRSSSASKSVGCVQIVNGTP